MNGWEDLDAMQHVTTNFEIGRRTYAVELGIVTTNTDIESS
jgi:hypothetical protein